MRIQKKTGLWFFRLLLILSMIVAAACTAGAQKEKVSFDDYSGHQFGAASDQLDVPYVPTPMKVVRALLDLASVGRDDFLIDLGSGDGRIVITAAKEYGARGFGVDLNEDLVALSKKYAVAEGVEKKVDFFVQDIFKTDIRRASVVTMYLLSYINIQLRPKLLNELKPGTRVVSHDFHMGDWRPERTIHMSSGEFFHRDSTIYLWIIPAKVAGRWQWVLPVSGRDQSFDLTLEQAYQDIKGEAKTQNYTLPIVEAELKGDRIQFTLFSRSEKRMIRHDYKGRVDGDTIVGTVELQGAVGKTPLQWQARKVR